MALIVQKFGGTSVGSIDRINYVASIIASNLSQNNQLVVVVSAMSGETNRLITLANQVDVNAKDTELALITTTGEQISVGLLSIALTKLGIDNDCFLGWQLPIVTTDNYTQARICNINNQKLLSTIKQNKVAIVAGFQGISKSGHLSTLGRGGSDTSAVALAVSLNADECQIYTDVDGIYNCDPNQIATAKKIDTIDGISMIEAASLGAKVLHVRSCELAYRYHINLRVLSSFNPNNKGTLVMNQTELENYPIINLSVIENQSLINFEISTNQLSKLLANLYQIGSLDMINLHANNVSFACDSSISDKLINAISAYPQTTNVTKLDQLNKISLIGSGFRSNQDLNQKVWELLDDTEIFSITHNEISMSFLIHNWDKARVRNELSKILM